MRGKRAVKKFTRKTRSDESLENKIMHPKWRAPEKSILEYRRQIDSKIDNATESYFWTYTSCASFMSGMWRIVELRHIPFYDVKLFKFRRNLRQGTDHIYAQTLNGKRSLILGDKTTMLCTFLVPCVHVLIL